MTHHRKHREKGIIERIKLCFDYKLVITGKFKYALGL